MLSSREGHRRERKRKRREATARSQGEEAEGDTRVPVPDGAVRTGSSPGLVNPSHGHQQLVAACHEHGSCVRLDDVMAQSARRNMYAPVDVDLECTHMLRPMPFIALRS